MYIYSRRHYSLKFFFLLRRSTSQIEISKEFHKELSNCSPIGNQGHQPKWRIAKLFYIQNLKADTDLQS